MQNKRLKTNEPPMSTKKPKKGEIEPKLEIIHSMLPLECVKILE